MQSPQDSKMSNPTFFQPKAVNPHAEAIDKEHKDLIAMFDKLETSNDYHFLEKSIKHYISIVLMKREDKEIQEDLKKLLDTIETISSFHKIKKNENISPKQFPAIETCLNNIKRSINIKTGMKKLEIDKEIQNTKSCVIL